MRVTEELAGFLVRTKLEDMPQISRETGVLCLMDWLAVTLAGHREPLGDIIFDLLGEMGGEKHATLVGRGGKTSLFNAALLNGSVSHALDYDDVHLKMSGHPSVPVAPAALALGEYKKVSGKQLLEAFILGVEAECRVAQGVYPNHYGGGFHATGTIGTFGAAVAAAKLLGLDQAGTVHALGLAGTQAAGVRQVFGTMAKPFHAGKAAMNGLMAALLAQRGFTCSTEILEGDMGFSSALASSCAPEKVVRDMGKEFFVDGVQFKWHASCFQTHPAIDAALALGRTFPAEEVKSVSLTLFPNCQRVANIKVPSTGLEGKFSIPFCIALTLTTNRTDEGQFTDAMVRRPDLAALLARVTITDDESLPTHLGKINMLTTTGQSFSAEANTLTLSQDHQVRKAKVEEKFLRLVTPVLGEEKTGALLERVKKLETLPDVSVLADYWAV